MANNNIKAERARNNYNYGKKMSKHGADKRHSDNYPDKNKNLLRNFLNGKTQITKDDYQEMLEIINANGKNAKGEYTPLGKAAYNKLQAIMDEGKKTPAAQPLGLSLEDRINNEFEEMAVSVAYGKNEQEKTGAVKKFAEYIRENVRPEEMDAAKKQISTRLKDDDFIYGSEFIDLKGLRPYEERMFAAAAEKTGREPENNQPEKTLNRPQTDRNHEQSLYQALVDGINNEDIKNPHKGYSNEDLKTILAHHDKLLENTDGNGTNFESLYENSYSDLKKFASGVLTIDNDSYDTMMEFIKTFGTDSKGRLTPEGKAAHDKLIALIADAKKQKIKQNKDNFQQNKNTDKNPDIMGIVGSLRDNAEKREKTPETKKEEENSAVIPGQPRPIAPVIIVDNDKENITPENTGAHSENNGNTPLSVIVPPVVNKPSDKGKDFVPANGTKKPKKDNWFKRNWKKLAAGAAFVAATLFGLSQCKSCTKDDDKKEDKKEVVTPTPAPAPVVKPKPEIKLTQEDLNNGFFLERSAGFKGEQSASSFADAETANKEEMLNLKKLLAKGELKSDAFVRNQDSKLSEDISLVEIAYKLRIITQNFPNSSVAQDINNAMKGNAKDIDKNNIYTAFNRVDDYGNVLNKKGEKIQTVPGTKNINTGRRGQGSSEYGTQGTFDNFLQVLNNHRRDLNK